MDAGQADTYLARIGYAGSRAPDSATLRALHRAHLYAVPFENLDIHLGRTIALDPAAFFHKIVGERRGGFCYELNGLFAELLAFLGFEVSLLSARVARGEDDGGGFGPEYDHLAVLVEAGGRWLADVGFGRAFHTPLSLDTPVEEEAEGTLYRAVPTPEGWRVESREAGGAAQPEYAFSLAPQPLSAFTEMCTYQQTSPAAHFTRKPFCTLPIPTGRVTVSGHTLIETNGGARRETLLDEAGRTEGLSTRFGIRLPAPLPRAPAAAAPAAAAPEQGN